jgi:hypothetical protein
MGFTELGDPFVRSYLILVIFSLYKPLPCYCRLDLYLTDSISEECLMLMRDSTSLQDSQATVCRVPLAGSYTLS